MAKLKGNLSGLVAPKVQDDKRDQLVPKKREPKTAPLTTSKKEGRKVGRKPVKKSDEPYIATRLLLPESLKEELDLFCIKNKVKGKNEFLVEAVRSHLKEQKVRRKR